MRAIRSFRFKLAALSLLFTSILLTLFGLLAWTTFYRMSVNMLDNEIESWTRQALSKERVVREWDRFAQDMNSVFARASGNGDPGAVVLLVRDRQHRIVYQSPKWPAALPVGLFPTPDVMGVPPPAPRSPDQSRRQPIGVAQHYSVMGFREYGEDRQAWRIGAMANEHVTLALGAPLNRLRGELGRLRGAFLLAMPVALLLSAVAGWYVAGRALRPIRRVTHTARSITAQKIGQRIPLHTEDVEFEELIQVFNAMLDRLQASYQQAVRFSADAAHELKTPLAVLQGEIEQALRDTESGVTAAPSLFALVPEICRLKAIVEKLLLLSKADAGRLHLMLEPANLVELVEESIEDAAILGPELTIERELPREAWVSVDRCLMRQVLQNLTSNAVKYNRQGGMIRYHMLHSEEGVILEIANTGPPIMPEHRERVFDRFYRCDTSRSPAEDGVGLGLSLAREIVTAHHGELRLKQAENDGLVVFSMSVPAR